MSENKSRRLYQQYTLEFTDKVTFIHKKTSRESNEKTQVRMVWRKNTTSCF